RAYPFVCSCGLFRRLWVVKSVASWTQQRLDRATLIHRAVTLRNLLERQRQVEDLAGIDLARPHEVDQLGQVAAYGGRTTVEVDVREEELLPSDLDAMRNTDRAVADDHGRHARLDVGGVRGKPARAHDVRERQQARDEVVRRKPWGGDQGAVRERDAQPRRLRTTDELAMYAGRLVSCAADRAGVVRRKERADDELAWLDRFDRAAHLLDHPAVLVAERCRLRHRLDAAVGPEVGPTHARGRHPDDRIRRLRDPRLFALL